MVVRSKNSSVRLTVRANIFDREGRESSIGSYGVLTGEQPFERCG